MADADHVFVEEVEKIDLLHGSRLEHILRAGQVQARKDLQVSIEGG